jgi:hypothetical protein
LVTAVGGLFGSFEFDPHSVGGPNVTAAVNFLSDQSSVVPLGVRTFGAGQDCVWETLGAVPDGGDLFIGVSPGSCADEIPPEERPMNTGPWLLRYAPATDTYLRGFSSDAPINGNWIGSIALRNSTVAWANCTSPSSWGGVLVDAGVVRVEARP